MEVDEQLKSSQDEIQDYFTKSEEKLRAFTRNNFLIFFKDTQQNLKTILQEPEILLFACLQFISLCAAYYLLVAVLNLLPDDVWNAAPTTARSKITNVIASLGFIVWTLLVIYAESYIFGFFNTAMFASHHLRSIGQKSSIARCLGIARQHAAKVWQLTIRDIAATSDHIAAHIPEKHNPYTLPDGIVYYSWKIASLFAIQSLVNGKDFIAAGKNAVLILKENPVRIIGIRLGYSALCCTIGMTTYILAFFFVPHLKIGAFIGIQMYPIYLSVGISILLSAGVIILFLKPLYIISVSRLYNEYINIRVETKGIIKTPDRSVRPTTFPWQLISFLVLVVTLLLTL